MKRQNAASDRYWRNLCIERDERCEGSRTEQLARHTRLKHYFGDFVRGTSSANQKKVISSLPLINKCQRLCHLVMTMEQYNYII